MKTIKIIFSIAGFALTSICFGQLLSQNNSDVLFYSAYHNLASNRIEHQVNQYPARTTSGDHFDAPVLSRTYFVPIEFDLGIEAWMTLPFESNYYEADPIIEQWMTAPFESGEEIEIEAWMSTIWI
jgi:hypothetical protein